MSLFATLVSIILVSHRVAEAVIVDYDSKLNEEGGMKEMKMEMQEKEAPKETYVKPVYKYGYSVFDPYTLDIKSQWEHRDGDLVKGAYNMLEADGSMRIVEYVADKDLGFRAVVKNIPDYYTDKRPVETFPVIKQKKTNKGPNPQMTDVQNIINNIQQTKHKYEIPLEPRTPHNDEQYQQFKSVTYQPLGQPEFIGKQHQNYYQSVNKPYRPENIIENPISKPYLENPMHQENYIQQENPSGKHLYQHFSKQENQENPSSKYQYQNFNKLEDQEKPSNKHHYQNFNKLEDQEKPSNKHHYQNFNKLEEQEKPSSKHYQHFSKLEEQENPSSKHHYQHFSKQEKQLKPHYRENYIQQQKYYNEYKNHMKEHKNDSKYKRYIVKK